MADNENQTSVPGMNEDGLYNFAAISKNRALKYAIALFDLETNSTVESVLTDAQKFYEFLTLE